MLIYISGVHYNTDESIAGVVDWQRPAPNADGESITLYEHKDQTTFHHGDPIADVFSILARPNSCILAVADGCGWGIKPRLAARCAVHGSIEHLNSKLFQSDFLSSPEHPKTTQDVFHIMYRSLHTAQKCIIQHRGTTTTLCLAVVVELAEAKAGNKWGVCVVSVGDSVCYVWRNDTQEVHEITAQIRDGKERNIRDAGGCLGADMGDHPDLSNLYCCYAPLADHDIVFLSSDGVSDNFDPVTLREALSESTGATSSLETTQNMTHQSLTTTSTAATSGYSLPVLAPTERQSRAMDRLSSLLREEWESKEHTLTATNVKDVVRNYVIEVTEEKRCFLEQVWAGSNHESLTPAQRREQDKQIGHTVKQIPGKLDHATIAVYQVGKIQSNDPMPYPQRRPHAATQSYCVIEPHLHHDDNHTLTQTQRIDTYSFRIEGTGDRRRSKEI